MKCEQVTSQLSAYMDGELPPQQAEEVRRHLAECPACAEEYRLLSQTWDILLADAAPEPSPGFTQRFWQKVRAQEQAAPRPARMLLRLLKWAPAMAAGFAVAFLAGWLSAGGHKPDRTGTLTAQDVAFLQNYDVLEQMELLEDLPLVQAGLTNDSEEGGEQ